MSLLLLLISLLHFIPSPYFFFFIFCLLFSFFPFFYLLLLLPVPCGLCMQLSRYHIRWTRMFLLEWNMSKLLHAGTPFLFLHVREILHSFLFISHLHHISFDSVVFMSLSTCSIGHQKWHYRFNLRSYVSAVTKIVDSTTFQGYAIS